MSYILDALRRADSERERGAVPGIHAQPVPIGSQEDGNPPRIKPWMWAAGGVAAGLLAWFGWQDLQHASPPAEPMVAAMDAPPVPMPQGASPPPPPPAAMPTPAAPPVRMAAPASIPPPARAAVMPQPPRDMAMPPPAPAKTSVPARAASEPAVAAMAASPPASSSADRLYAINELPDAIQRELPKVTVGASIYSDNAASRFLVINGQVFHENDQIQPGLLLEQIKLKAAVLRYKGYRYGISY
jgi:general secretion pathway protein B